jgi:hypothetical protein
MEDGNYRHHAIKKGELPVDEGGVNAIDQRMLHVLDLGGNYWSLWTEADALARFRRAHPQALETLRRRLGYRVRPAWVWQRKRAGTSEVVVAFANDGVSGVPGLLRVSLETADGRVRVAGALEAGRPLAGRLRLGAFLLPKGLEGQTLRLVAELETRGVRRPVRWACAQPLDAQGGFPIRLKPFSDADWRKGI